MVHIQLGGGWGVGVGWGEKREMVRTYMVHIQLGGGGGGEERGQGGQM
jgi:hypothetical protein